MTTNNNESADNFKFEDFLSDDSKKEIEPVAPEIKNEEVVETPPQKVETIVETKVEPIAEVPKEIKEEPATPDPEISEPVRAPKEPEWKYEYRRDIWQKQQELKNAATPAEKSEKKAAIEGIRQQIAERSHVEDPTKTVPVDEIPKEDLYKVVNDLVAQREYMSKLDDVETNFLKAHKVLSSPEKSTSFFNFVGETYNIRGKTPKQVNAILEMAYETLYPDRTEEKVDKSKTLDKKMAAVDFTGSNGTQSSDLKKEDSKKLVDKIKEKSGHDFGWAVD